MARPSSPAAALCMFRLGRVVRSFELRRHLAGANRLTSFHPYHPATACGGSSAA